MAAETNASCVVCSQGRRRKKCDTCELRLFCSVTCKKRSTPEFHPCAGSSSGHYEERGESCCAAFRVLQPPQSSDTRLVHVPCPPELQRIRNLEPHDYPLQMIIDAWTEIMAVPEAGELFMSLVSYARSIDERTICLIPHDVLYATAERKLVPGSAIAAPSALYLMSLYLWKDLRKPDGTHFAPLMCMADGRVGRQIIVASETALCRHELDPTVEAVHMLVEPRVDPKARPMLREKVREIGEFYERNRGCFAVYPPSSQRLSPERCVFPKKRIAELLSVKV
jgi:hypothetical protein